MEIDNMHIKSDELLKDEKVYLKLILCTGITGAYNFYLGKDKKAMYMMLQLIISIFCNVSWGIIGAIVSVFIVIKDIIMLKKDIDKYNTKIKHILTLDNMYDEVIKIKTKSPTRYKCVMLLFGIVKLEDFYLDDYKINPMKGFISHGLYLILMSITSVIMVLGKIYLLTICPESSTKLVSTIVEQSYVWSILFSGLSIFINLSPRLSPFFIIKSICKLGSTEIIVWNHNKNINL